MECWVGYDMASLFECDGPSKTVATTAYSALTLRKSLSAKHSHYAC
jgi:hypothetical protein